MSRKDLVRSIAEHMMLANRGFKVKDDYPIEWDESRTDSQISGLIEDIEMILSYLEDPKQEPEEKPEEEELITGNTFYWSPSPPNTPATKKVLTSVSIGIALRERSTVKDLREFVGRLDRIKISDDFVLEGYLYADKDFDDTYLDRIECGDCGDRDYLFYSDEHSCN